MKQQPIAVVVPFYQKKPGLLEAALRSIFSQAGDHDLLAIVVDDGSPLPARDELANCSGLPSERIRLITQANGGAGAARNRALDAVPDGTRYVAFLDSDDTWRPNHIANALLGLSAGHDAYFSDWWSFNFPEQTNFERIKALKPEKHTPVPNAGPCYELGVSPLEHILADGGGVIQTSTVVYRFDRFKELRFREEFFNGQDFFFWIDLGQLGARFVYSTEVDCENGEGINIYQGAGWGTERSLQRLRNELFVWTSVKRFYALTPELRAKNKATIRNLQRGVIRDLLYRLRRRLPISRELLADIFRFDPYILALPPGVFAQILMSKFHGTKSNQAD